MPDLVSETTDGRNYTSERVPFTRIKRKEELIRNGGSALNQSARRLCLQALENALRAVDPYRCLQSQAKVRNGRLSVGKLSISLLRFRKIALMAVGKASMPMAGAMLDILRDFPVHGIVVAPKGDKIGSLNKPIQVFRSGHPIPDHDGLEASKHVIETVRKIGKDELLICLISGGASAMLPAPPTGITLQDKRQVTESLVKSKATIHEINAVRRHLSTLKGGRLVELCIASTILSLIISDVPGNPLADIASGLTVEDPTTYHDAIQILRTHGLWKTLPSRVVDHFTKGLNGVFPETPKPGDPAFQRVHNLIVADNRTACMGARQALKSGGIAAEVLTSTAEMEANSMGRLLASIAVSCKEHEEPIADSGAIIIGGETTVEVRGKGIGGRNQETALWAVDSVAGLRGTAIAALGTDGIDGNSNAAGAIIDGNTEERANRRRLHVQDFLARNDSYRFFRKLNDNLMTGRTGTNVGDLYLLVRRA